MAAVDINWNPSKRDLRWFAGLQVLFFAFVGFLIAHHSGSVATGAVVCSISAIVGLMGLFRPVWIRPVYVIWMTAVFPVGWVLSHLVLAAVFFLVFTPFGLVMRIAGKDPLSRRPDRSAQTYWIPRKERPDLSHYFRQF